MREEREVKKSISVPIKCDKCGKKFDADDYREEYISIDYVAGYGAKCFCDDDRVSFDLCEECLYNFVKTLNIEILNNIHGKSESKEL